MVESADTSGLSLRGRFFRCVDEDKSKEKYNESQNKPFLKSFGIKMLCGIKEF